MLCVCVSPSLPLCGLVGRDVCCVCLCVPHWRTCLCAVCRYRCVFCVSLTGKPAPVRSCREGNLSVYPSPANLPLCDLVGRDMCCVCVSLTAPVWSCREGCVVCVSVCPSLANLPLCGLLGRDVLCVCVCMCVPHWRTCPCAVL